jgi:hypothetical protein
MRLHWEPTPFKVACSIGPLERETRSRCHRLNTKLPNSPSFVLGGQECSDGVGGGGGCMYIERTEVGPALQSWRLEPKARPSLTLEARSMRP